MDDGTERESGMARESGTKRRYGRRPAGGARGAGWMAATAMAFAMAAAGAPALAHTVPMTAQEMVRASRFIVVARVERATPLWNERHNLILTRYTLIVEDPLRGTPPRELEVTEAGGTLDGETQRSCMTVGLETGRRYVLFVNDPAVPTFSAFTGAQSGALLEVPADRATGPAASRRSPRPAERSSS